MCQVAALVGEDGLEVEDEFRVLPRFLQLHLELTQLPIVGSADADRLFHGKKRPLGGEAGSIALEPPLNGVTVSGGEDRIQGILPPQQHRHPVQLVGQAGISPLGPAPAAAGDQDGIAPVGEQVAGWPSGTGAGAGFFPLLVCHHPPPFLFVPHLC